MEDYINGCYTKYGTRSMNIFEVFHKEILGNGFYYNIGYIDTKEDGISMDIYKDGKLISWQHGIRCKHTAETLKTATDFSIFTDLAISCLAEMKLL